MTSWPTASATWSAASPRWSQPWVAARLERAGDQQAGRQLDAILGTLIRACRTIAGLLAPFLPDAAARVAQQCAGPDGRLPAPAPVFRRLEVAGPSQAAAVLGPAAS